MIEDPSKAVLLNNNILTKSTLSGILLRCPIAMLAILLRIYLNPLLVLACQMLLIKIRPHLVLSTREPGSSDMHYCRQNAIQWIILYLTDWRPGMARSTYYVSQSVRSSDNRFQCVYMHHVSDTLYVGLGKVFLL